MVSIAERTVESMPAPRRRLHYGWVVLVMATLAVFGVLGLGRFGYTMVLPAMQNRLGLSNTLAGSLATANLVGYAAMSLVGGILAARFGPRKVLPIGIGVAALGMALTGTAHGFAGAATWRLVTGVGAGLAYVPATVLAGAWFARRLRGLATGVVVTGSSIGLIVTGPLVPRVLGATGPDGWRTVWWIYGAITAIFAVAAYLLIRDRPTDMQLLPVGAAESGPIPSRTHNSLAGAATGDPGMVPGTSEWRQIYRSPAVWHLGLVYFAFGLAYLSFMTFFTKYLTTTGGYSAQAAGDLYMLLGWCTVVSGALWGTISDRIGRKWGLAAAYLLHTLAFALFGLWQAPAGYTTAAVLFGLSAWAAPAIMAATCIDVFGARLAPAALGFITVLFAAGSTAGPTIAGALADAAGSFVPAFLFAAGVSALGAIAAAALKPTVTRH